MSRAFRRCAVSSRFVRFASFFLRSVSFAIRPSAGESKTGPEKPQATAGGENNKKKKKTHRDVIPCAACGACRVSTRAKVYRARVVYARDVRLYMDHHDGLCRLASAAKKVSESQERAHSERFNGT